MQLSTRRLSFRAWVPGFCGVLEIDIWQNSPQRHSLSFIGQRNIPHACPPPPCETVHPWASAWLIAASTSLSLCRERVTMTPYSENYDRRVQLSTDNCTRRSFSLIG